MLPAERIILQWIVGHATPEIGEALSSQFEHIRISDRNFTDGGGVSVGLNPGKSGKALSAEWRASYSAIEGPDLESSELESGASAILHFNESGFADSLEIWAHAGDYPTTRHPESVSLIRPSSTYIDLRVQGKEIQPSK